MIDLDILKESYKSTSSKIVMLVVDGLGGLAHPESRLSELETANIPNLDSIANESACGLSIPVMTGITPGSGPGHLALFGYDPLKYYIGRGALEALGIGIKLQDGDIAARGNFCTVDESGLLTDRRAGRLSEEIARKLCADLDNISVDGVRLSVHYVEGYRFVLHINGKGLSDQISETDPQSLGVVPLEPRPISESARKMTGIVSSFVHQAKERLKHESNANMVLLRGFSGLPHMPSMSETFKLYPAAIASYPMYRGISSILGMKVIPTGNSFSSEIDTLRTHYGDHDFFYIHYKYADTAGEDGDFEGKVRALEALDSQISRLMELLPDVFIVAGDHSTPAIHAGHSWHPVPFMIRSRLTLGEGIETFSEKSCRRGSLGTFPATHIMLLALSHAGKLAKFGP